MVITKPAVGRHAKNGGWLLDACPGKGNQWHVGPGGQWRGCVSSREKLGPSCMHSTGGVPGQGLSCAGEKKRKSEKPLRPSFEGRREEEVDESAESQAARSWARRSVRLADLTETRVREWR